MTLQELETQLLALTPMEQAEAIQILTRAVGSGTRGITKTSGVCGGDACIGGTRIPVWGLVESRRLGATEAELLSNYPHLTAADLVNAWIYADAHSEEIEQAIRENEAVMQEDN